MDKRDFDMKAFCAEQMQKDDTLIRSFEGVYRIKLGFAKQYNNAIKNDIDADRVDMQKKSVIKEVARVLSK